MSYLAIVGWIILGAFFGMLVTSICAAASRSDEITHECMIRSQEDIIEKLTKDFETLNTKYEKAKLELHTSWHHNQDGGKYPLDGGTD